MENASKALIMAGAILIAIMIISLSLMVFNNFGNFAKENANMEKEEIQAFNSKITPYIGRISGSQVNSLLQYCISSNIAANNSDDTAKLITVRYPEGVIDGNSTTYKRVSGASYYNVEATPDSDGLMTTITITE